MNLMSSGAGSRVSAQGSVQRAADRQASPSDSRGTSDAFQDVLGKSLEDKGQTQRETVSQDDADTKAESEIISQGMAKTYQGKKSTKSAPLKKEQPGKEGTLTGEETEALSADALLSALQALLQQQEAAGTGQTDIAAEGKAQEAAAGNSSQQAAELLASAAADPELGSLLQAALEEIQQGGMKSETLLEKGASAGQTTFSGEGSLKNLVKNALLRSSDGQIQQLSASANEGSVLPLRSSANEDGAVQQQLSRLSGLLQSQGEEGTEASSLGQKRAFTTELLSSLTQQANNGNQEVPQEPLTTSMLSTASEGQKDASGQKTSRLRNLLGLDVHEETRMQEPVVTLSQGGLQAGTDAQEDSSFSSGAYSFLPDKQEEEPLKAPARNLDTPQPQFAQAMSSLSPVADADGAGSINTPQNAAPPPRTYDVPQQIVDQARLIRSSQDTEMVIHLKPEHLGNLTLRVSVSPDGSVNASFHSNNAEVRTIIENSLVQLRQDMNQQGLKVDHIGVYAGLADGGLPQDQGQQGFAQQFQDQQQHHPQESLLSFADEAEAIAALENKQTVSGETAMDGVDYRI